MMKTSKSKKTKNKSLESFERHRRMQAQNYVNIKRKCREDGQLFEDELFPATNDSFFCKRLTETSTAKRKSQQQQPQLGKEISLKSMTKKRSDAFPIAIEWKRPHEIKSNLEANQSIQLSQQQTQIILTEPQQQPTPTEQQQQPAPTEQQQQPTPTEQQQQTASTEQPPEQPKQQSPQQQEPAPSKSSPPASPAASFSWSYSATQSSLQSENKFMIFDEETGVPKANWALGKLGNQWFLGAVATILSAKGGARLVEQIAPPQTFEKDDYFGIFYFRIWYFGRWREVVVDDRLPTYKGQLLMSHDMDLVQWWVPLLEKAYAKLVGGYEPMGGSYLSEGLVDFTAGGCESYKLEQLPMSRDEMFSSLFKAVQRESLVCVYIEPKDLRKRRKEISNIGGKMKSMTGFKGGQRGSCYAFYSVTAVNSLDFKQETQPRQLLRLRNLQGQEIHWTGAWAPNSDEWKMVPNEQREQFGLIIDYEGEFWIPMDDFLNVFTRIDMCHLPEFRFPSALELAPMVARKQVRNKFFWTGSCRLGRWEEGLTDGGCGMNIKSFEKNPRYFLELSDVFIDRDDDSRLVSVVATLMQMERSCKRLKGVFDLKIGVCVYKVPAESISGHKGKLLEAVPDRRPGELYPITADDLPLPENFFGKVKPIVRSRFFINHREISLRMRLQPGIYLLIPCTFDPGQVGTFLLRLFVEKADLTLELDSALRYLSYRPRSENTLNSSDPVAVSKVPSLIQFGSNLFKTDPKLIAGRLSASTLSRHLNESIKSQSCQLNQEHCRALVAVYDETKTGVLPPDKFFTLVADLKACHSAYRAHLDTGRPRLMTDQLASALGAMSIKDVSSSTIDVLNARYGNFESTSGKRHIDFGDFCCIALRLRHAMAIWNNAADEKKASASFTMNDFLGHVFYS